MNADPILGQQLKTLYDQNRFVDAYQICRHLYDEPDQVKPYPVETLILLGRLAGRLGGQSRQDHLFTLARDKAPEDPLVIYYAGRSEATKQHVLFRLFELEKNPEPVFSDISLKVSYLGTYAWIFAMLRDFENAHCFIEKAKSINTNNAWIKGCEAEVLFREGRWEEALKAVETAWEISPGMPQTAVTLGNILSRLNQVEIAVKKLLPAAEKGQSYETLMTALWFLCGMAERSSPDARKSIAQKAWDLSQKIESLMPLADTAVKANLASARIDIALVLEDTELIAQQQHAREIPFYKKILENITRNEHKPKSILDYRLIYQKHDTCLPTSIASVLGCFGIYLKVNELVAQLTYRGTAVWRVMDWLAERDFACKTFIPNPALSIEMLRAGLPFVLLIQDVDYYHATAAIGLDETAGLLIIHDPAYIRLDQILLEELGKNEKLFSFEGLAIVPQDKRHLLDIIPDADSQPYQTFIDFCRVKDTKGPKSTEPIVAQLKEAWPDHPIYKRVLGIYHSSMGDPATAISIQKKLLETYSESEPIRQEFLQSLHQTGNSSQIRKTLAKIVLKKKIPGIRARQTWQYPPANIVARYVDFIGVDEAGFKKAEMLLWKALSREPYHAQSYHILGDIYKRQNQNKKSVIPYRCAAVLDYENDHYARAYCDALRDEGQEEKGVEFLVNRVKKLGNSLMGARVWITLIQTFESYGYPEDAIEHIEAASNFWDEDPDMQSFAVKFWIRIGFWEKARQALEAVKKTGHRIKYLNAMADFYRRSGKWEKALAAVKPLVEEEPENNAAWEQYADLLAFDIGRRKALEIIQKWREKNLGNDYFDGLYYNKLGELFEKDKQIELIESRLKRNPYDAWALRELGFKLQYKMKYTAKEEAAEVQKKLDRVRSSLARLCPKHPVFIALKADVAAYHGKMKEACQLFVNSLMVDPQYEYAYQRAWDCSQNLDESEQLDILNDMETAMFCSVDNLHIAREIAFMIADRFGIRKADEMVDSWLKRRPNDPELAEAKADLFLYYGKGQSDAKKAVLLLEAETVRFPHHHGLRYSLAYAWRILQQEDKQIHVMEDILKINPLNSDIRCQLALVYNDKGQFDKAIGLLAQGMNFDPLNEDIYIKLVRHLWAIGDRDKAKEIIYKGLEKIPENIKLRTKLIGHLLKNGEYDMAVDIARQGIEEYPNGAYLWQVLADTLWKSENHTDMMEIEQAYKMALKLNPRLFDAADALSELLTYQQKFGEAVFVLETHLQYSDDVAGVKARMAWIGRKQGQLEEPVRQIVSNLELYPSHKWSWHLLLEWLEEDESWDQVKKLLRDIHPVMLDDPNFNSKRLMLLERSGFVRELLENEWKRLLNEYPQNETIHTRRFDLLIESQDYETAGRLIDGIAQYHADSQFVIARQAAQRAWIGQVQEAIDYTLRLWQLPDVLSNWCLDYAYEAICRINAQESLLIKSCEVVVNGQKIQRNAFTFFLDQLQALWPERIRAKRWKFLNRLTHSRLFDTLKMFLQRRFDLDPDDGFYIAQCLQKMCDIGRFDYVFQYLNAKPAECYQITEIWQVIGHALNRCSKNGKLLEWMENWESHDGCEMWAVANYLIGMDHCKTFFRPIAYTQKIYQVSKTVIEKLPHDHTTKYIVCLLCEACLKLGKDDEFTEYATRFAPILKDEQNEFWTSADKWWVPGVIYLFNELINTSNRTRIDILTKQLGKSAPIYEVKSWVRREWLKRLRQKLDQGNRVKAWFILYAK